MRSFPERVSRLEEVLATRQAKDGGWPHRLDVKNAATSIPSTAHVIEILRARNYEYGHHSIQDGLKYLATFMEHVRLRGKGGRGSARYPARGSARYPAFALWGLTRYPQGALDDSFGPAIKQAVRWLADHRLEGGGWATDRDGTFSLTVTMPAVHAFDRLSYHPTHGEAVTALAAEARRRVVREARGTKASAWWTPQGDAGQPSGATTAMAVLTLAAGTPDQRKVARAGIAWLLQHPEEWIAKCEADIHIENRSWQMLSFSLGLRAVLHPCADESPSQPILEAAIQHWDDLWIEEPGAWTHIPGDKPNTSGSFGVIVAARGLKRWFEFDPALHLNVKPRKRRRKKKPEARSTLSLTIDRERQEVKVVNQLGHLIVDTRIQGPKQWLMLQLVAERHHAGQGSNDQAQQTITLAELANANESSEEACVRAIERVNTRLSKWAKENGRQHLPTLIEDIRDPRGETADGFGFDTVESVDFVDGLD